jgi:hypothetical protein
MNLSNTLMFLNISEKYIIVFVFRPWSKIVRALLGFCFLCPPWSDKCDRTGSRLTTPVAAFS